MSNLAGIHDREGAHIVPDDGWVLDTIALSENPIPPVYDPRLNWIVRANWNYGSSGTLPIPAGYDDYLDRLCAYARASQNCHRWVIGNEPNLSREWPNGQPIFPWQYAQCYKMARRAIRAMAGHEYDEVLIAAPGPWNNELKYEGNSDGDWIQYFVDVIGECGNEIGGFSLHGYTHGYNISLVTSSARMQSPFQHRHYEFRAYRDYMEAIPASLRHLPVYLTEANGNGPWQAVGLMPAMLNEIDGWNKTARQPIQAVIFYRYPKKDDFYMEGRADVIAEFQAAVSRGYESPQNNAQTHSELMNTPALPDRDIDPRATARGVTIETPSGSVLTWRVTEIHWLDEKQSQGRHHIYANVLDEQGERLVNVPLLVAWPTGWTVVTTEAKPGEPWSANFPMSPSRNEFSVKVDGLALSETVKGIGMGADTPGGFNAGVHTSTAVVFQRVTAATPPALPPIPQPPEPTTVYIPAIGTGALPSTVWVAMPAGVNLRGGPGTEFAILEEMPQGTSLTVTGSTSTRDWYQVRKGNLSGWTLASLLNAQPVATPAPEPQAADDNWSRAWPIVLKFEGGLSLDPNDSGNYFDGKLIGTKFGISAASWGGQYDIPNLTQVQALDIYKRHYWDAAGCEALPWPTCLIHFDTAINHGVSVAILLKARQPTPEEIYLGLRALRYFQDPKWRNFGVAWGLRVGHLDDIAKGKVNA